MADQTLAGRLKRLIASLGRHGPGHVLEVLRQGRIRRAYAENPPELPDREVFLQLFPPQIRSADSLVTELTKRSRELLTPWLNDPQRTEEVRSGLRSADTSFRRDAALICAGRFPALGLCIAEPEGKFDWHRDYGSGRTWPRDPFHRIRFLEGDGADVKYPWELSRMYWIGWLGSARLIETDDGARGEWSKAFRRLIDDWGRENPIHTGVNWAMPMEVGIRGFWLAAGGAFFGDAADIPVEWWLDYYRLLFGHGRYLARNLEYFPNLTNHYIANCFGLMVTGALFIDTAEGKKWFDDGKRRMGRELERQVTPDGVHYERSISYHALVLEMYVIAGIIAERVGKPFGPQEREIIARMTRFVRDYLPPAEATAPQFGDSDDGIILRLTSDHSPYDHRPLLHLASSFLQSDTGTSAEGNGQRLKESVSPSLPTLLFGLPSVPSSSPPSSRLYRDGGFALLRNSRWHLTADVGPIGLHGNNDTLSFTLHSSDGRAWLIDPGTGCYTRSEALRNELRSTAAHNAPFVDREEIARFSGLWRVESDRTRTEIITSNLEEASGEADDPLLLTARHHAYDTLPGGGIVVERHWRMEGDQVEIRDRLLGSGRHRVEIGFTVPEEVRGVKIAEDCVELRHGNQPGSDVLRITCSNRVNIRESVYSPGYGLLLPSTRIEISVDGEAPLEIAYLCRFVSNQNS